MLTKFHDDSVWLCVEEPKNILTHSESIILTCFPNLGRKTRRKHSGKSLPIDHFVGLVYFPLWVPGATLLGPKVEDNYLEHGLWQQIARNEVFKGWLQPRGSH